MLSQPNVNRSPTPIRQPKLEPPDSAPNLSTQTDVSGAMCKEERAMRDQISTQTPTPVPDSVTKLLQSLAGLEQRAASQTKALQSMKTRALALSPTRSLLKEIKTLRLAMEATLAALSALWCEESPVAVGVKQGLKSKLQENIEDIECMETIRTNADIPASGTPVTMSKAVDVDRPGGAFDHEYAAQYTDVSGRQTLYPLLAGLQLPLAAKPVPSACPGLSRPLNSALKQL
jgi:hypothetical protein